MALHTGLTYRNVLGREPALQSFDPAYATAFAGLIAEAKVVIDNRLRAMGLDLNKIGIKNYIWNNDNPNVGDLNKHYNGDFPYTEPNTLLIVTGMLPPEYSVVVEFSGGAVFSEAEITDRVFGAILPYMDRDFFIELSGGYFVENRLQVYLTDPAIYMVHLYKSLELIFESITAEPGDLFEQKAERYRQLYEQEFATLVTVYDTNGDGVVDGADNLKQLKQVRFTR